VVAPLISIGTVILSFGVALALSALAFRHMFGVRRGGQFQAVTSPPPRATPRPSAGLPAGGTGPAGTYS
jgi:hypothetical protein